MIINLNIPKSWNDLNSRQLRKIARIFHDNMFTILFDYCVFNILLDVRPWQFRKRYKARKTINNVGFSELKKHYPWIYSSLSLTTFLPSIKIKNKTLYAPADRINNLTVNEFAFADDLYLGWYSTKDFEYLYYLAAVLYRELDKNKKRIIFDKTQLDARSKTLNKIEKKILLSILLSYQGCRSYMFSQFPIVFPKPKTKIKAPLKSGFGKLILHLSGGKFGTHNETKDTNIYTFLSEFEEQLKNKPYA